MLERGHDAGVLSGWVTADEAYGQNKAFRAWLAARQLPYVLATRNDDVLVSPDGHRRQAKVLATLAATAPDGGWERRSAGAGAHGQRVYDWAGPRGPRRRGFTPGWAHWLLLRRQVEPSPGKTTRELAFYRCAGPATTPLRELIRVAATRWAIEECLCATRRSAVLHRAVTLQHVN
jgi:SRSO17 transposase